MSGRRGERGGEVVGCGVFVKKIRINIAGQGKRGIIFMNQAVGYQGIRGAGKRIDTDFVWPRKGTKKRPKKHLFWSSFFLLKSELYPV